MPDKTVAVNRRARHEYAVEETLEAGIALTGTEIKSIRAGRANLDRKSTRLNSSHPSRSRMPSSA